MALSTAQIQTELLQQSILLTGAPRSGTTLLGKLLSSLKGLEYHFEPPSLYMIAAAYSYGEIPRTTAAHLLSTYLTEDLFLESVHGRAVNLRPKDDSQVFNRMTWSDLNFRWQDIADRNDAISYVQEHKLRFAVKMPNLYDSLPLMADVFPQGSLIISVRNGANVIRSIIRKGWVSDEGLLRDLWPYGGCRKGVNIPYWVEPEFHERWPEMSAASRATLMWTTHAEWGIEALQTKDSFSRVHQVRYEELLNDAWSVVEKMADFLGSEETIHTQRWIDTIRTPKSMREGDSRDFAATTDRDILERFERVNDLWGY